MKVLICGQEPRWTKELQKLLNQDMVDLCAAVSQDIRLVITDFPIETMRKGILSKVPFLVVSKEKREERILEAFEKGAEDYMIYPISPKIARVRILRILKNDRNDKMEEEYLKNLQKQVHFTPNEYRILSFLMSYPGKVFSRNELLEEALPENYEGYDRNVDNYVKQIRKKLASESGKKEFIETVHGVGYRYQKPREQDS